MRYQLLVSPDKTAEELYPDAQFRSIWNRVVTVRDDKAAASVIEEMGCMPDYLACSSGFSNLIDWMIRSDNAGLYTFPEKFSFHFYDDAKKEEKKLDEYLAGMHKNCDHNIPLSQECRDCFLDLPTGYEGSSGV